MFSQLWTPNAVVNPTNPETWSTSLIVLAIIIGIVGLILTVVTLVWFVVWIKYSWIIRENSANLTGGALVQKYLETYGINAKRIKFKGFGKINNITVESRLFYLSPYLLVNGNFRLRLVPWTYHRRSVYTLAISMESAWAVSSAHSSRFNTFWWDFVRKMTLFFILIPFALALLFALAPSKAWLSLSPQGANILSIVLSVLASCLLILFAAMQLTFYAKSRKEICRNLVGILNKKEIRAINLIFQIKFIYYLIRMIYEILQLIFRIIMYVQGEK